MELEDLIKYCLISYPKEGCRCLEKKNALYRAENEDYEHEMTLAKMDERIYRAR